MNLMYQICYVSASLCSYVIYKILLKVEGLSRRRSCGPLPVSEVMVNLSPEEPRLLPPSILCLVGAARAAE